MFNILELFKLVIISCILMTFTFDSRVILWGEIRCQSLVGVKGLCGHVNSSAFVTGSGNCRVVICGGVCIINWPLPLGGFQGKYRQIEKLWVNGVLKSPKRQKVDQLAIYKVQPRSSTQKNRNKSREWEGGGLELGPSDYKTRALNHLATLPP